MCAHEIISQWACTYVDQPSMLTNQGLYSVLKQDRLSLAWPQNHAAIDYSTELTGDMAETLKLVYLHNKLMGEEGGY